MPLMRRRIHTTSWPVGLLAAAYVKYADSRLVLRGLRSANDGLDITLDEDGNLLFTVQAGEAGAAEWGNIEGVIGDQADLSTALAAKAATTHSHALSAVTGLQGALDGKADTTHAHAIGDVTGLQGALDGKAATSHGTHVPNGGTTGQALQKASDDDGDVEWGSPAGGSAIDAWPVGSIFISAVSTDPATLLGGGTWAAFGAGRVLVGIDAGQAEFDTALETGGAKTHTLSSAEMPAHTHVQDAHTHTQDSHNHTQDAHTHTQNSHTHDFLPRSATSGSVSSIVTGTLDTSSTISGANQPHVQAATATNQNATATNQAATATNQNATATNQSTGGGGAHNNLQPYIVVYMWRRTA